MTERLLINTDVLCDVINQTGHSGGVFDFLNRMLLRQVGHRKEIQKLLTSLPSPTQHDSFPRN